MMKRFLLIMIGSLSLFLFAQPARAEVVKAQGEILRFFDTHANDWSSYILIKDSLNKESNIYVHPKITVVRRGSQIEDISQLTGGMKVTVLYRTEGGGNLRATIVQIDGAIRV